MNTTMLKVILPAAASISLLLGAIGCVTEPVTGRKQFNIISPGQESQLGLASFQQLKQEVPVTKNSAAQAMVEKVGRRIAAVAGPDLPNAQWEFVVFESKEMNAFCLPGGKVGVYTGILEVTKDEGGLATVLGHEIAHATARHGAARMSQALALQTGGQILGASLSTASPATQAAVSSLYGMGSQLGVALPHSRGQESAADEIGLIYMARAGYDPRSAIDFWTRFAQATAAGGKQPWFLSTHPVSEDRIEHLRRIMPRALQEFQRNSPISR